MDDILSGIANSAKPLPSRFSKSQDGFSRSQVVDAFHQAFELIGGVNRLVMWAHENPGDFFRLYAKLLPATTVNIGDTGKVIIEHTIRRGALDQHEDDAKIIDVAIESMTEGEAVTLLSSIPSNDAHD